MLVSLCSGGCAGSKASLRRPGVTPTRPPAASVPQRVEMPGMVVRAGPDPIVGLETYDAEVLMDLGAEQFQAEAYDEAIRVYRKLLKEFPKASVVPLARYNSGLAFERLEEWKAASTQFQAIVKDFPQASVSNDAYFSLARAYGKLEDWPAVVQTFREARENIRPLEAMDELEARVGTGVGLFMQDNFISAEREFQRAVRFYEDHEQREILPADYFVGQARFYLGEMAAREFENVRFSAPPASSSEDVWLKKVRDELELKCERLLRAQTHLIRAIRVGHRGWATAAGFRIGSLYEHLFDALVAAPVPPDLGPEVAEVYQEELRSRVEILVKKAIQIYEANRAMAQRVGERNEWVDRTNVALERMKKRYLEGAALESSF